MQTVNQVKRNYFIPKWVDEGLERLYQSTGERKALHVQRALIKYLHEQGIDAEEIEHSEFFELHLSRLGQIDQDPSRLVDFDDLTRQLESRLST